MTNTDNPNPDYNNLTVPQIAVAAAWLRDQPGHRLDVTDHAAATWDQLPDQLRRDLELWYVNSEAFRTAVADYWAEDGAARTERRPTVSNTHPATTRNVNGAVVVQWRLPAGSSIPADYTPGDRIEWVEMPDNIKAIYRGDTPR